MNDAVSPLPGTEPVLWSIEGAIAVITINRAEARNAVNLAVAQGVAAALDELDARDDLSVGIITGAGQSFCAGMDLKAYLRGELPRVQGRGFAGLTEKLPRKPLIAAVEGYALAGGFEIALACDLIVASETAIFGLPEVKRGLVATGGGLLRLPKQIPFRVAMQYALTGANLSAPRALDLGLINMLTAPGEALARAMDLARTIAANAPMALAATKEIILSSGEWPAEERFARQRKVAEPAFNSADAREGAQAFAEKRAPVWRGR
ncbi:MAG: caiD 2 [Rhizorhabdus sp.]|nr:caiD 2 [Rhizorhabdus sp.]